MQAQRKTINLPYLQYDSYLIALFSRNVVFPHRLVHELEEIGYRQTSDGVCIIKTSGNWAGIWAKTFLLLKNGKFLESTEVVLTADDYLTDDSEERKSAVEINEIASNLWLGDVLRHDKLMCYFQPIISDFINVNNKKVFGYESFVRAKGEGDEVIGGNKIIQASKALNIEYMVDRLLHVQAIKTFASSKKTGFLFVNFLTGFIQRPEIYLEGLRENAKLFGIVPQNLVLEFSCGEDSGSGDNNVKHLRNVCEYAKMQGYSIALDDVCSPERSKKLLKEIRPDFVKVDLRELDNIDNNATLDTIRQILGQVEAAGCSIIAESVETEKQYEQLKSIGVGLFQGYLFSAPAP